MQALLEGPPLMLAQAALSPDAERGNQLRHWLGGHQLNEAGAARPRSRRRAQGIRARSHATPTSDPASEADTHHGLAAGTNENVQARRTDGAAPVRDVTSWLRVTVVAARPLRQCPHAAGNVPVYQVYEPKGYGRGGPMGGETRCRMMERGSSDGKGGQVSDPGRIAGGL